jgi:xanthine dehydrogenase/oxidase
VRGPGWIPANFFTEHIAEHAASALGVAPDTFKQANFYQKGQVTPSGTKLTYWNIDVIYSQIKTTSDYDARVLAVQAYNAANQWTKRGIAISPVRFGLGWKGAKYSCLVSILGDGSVDVTHAGVEIGQGVDTKVAQTVAYLLGIPLNQINVKRHTSQVTPNVSGTGGSITSGLCSYAAYNACTELNTRLAPIKAQLGPTALWTQIVQKAISSGIFLSATGFESPQTAPNPSGVQYNSYAAGVTEVLVDVLTGEHQILRTDILFDAGKSLNPVVDIGQVEGGYVMGLGLFLTEEISYDPSNGLPYQYNTWEYKPLTAFDIPLDLRVSLLKNSINPVGFLSSKASGEPPLALGSGALIAIQHALADYRSRSGKDTKNYSINAPASPATTQLSTGMIPSELTF